MQAVILAAGKSQRFYPFSNLAHKSLVKVGGRPLIEHVLLSLKSSSISEVVIVVSPGSAIRGLLGEGSRFGLSIVYVEQQEALGMGDALLQAEKYITSDFVLLNAYRVDIAEFLPSMMEKKTKDNIVFLGKEDPNYDTYGYIQV